MAVVRILYYVDAISTLVLPLITLGLSHTTSILTTFSTPSSSRNTLSPWVLMFTCMSRRVDLVLLLLLGEEFSWCGLALLFVQMLNAVLRQSVRGTTTGWW